MSNRLEIGSQAHDILATVATLPADASLEDLAVAVQFDWARLTAKVEKARERKAAGPVGVSFATGLRRMEREADSLRVLRDHLHRLIRSDA